MTQHPWRVGATFGGLGGVFVGTTAMRAAWLHNPQGEIYDASGIHWGYWFLIGLGWFLPVAFIVSLATGGILAIAGCLRRRGAA